jgi:hypothetical protein
MKEYIVSLNGRRIDSNGFYSAYGVTASTKADAKRLATKAKRHYFGRVTGVTVTIKAN